MPATRTTAKIVRKCRRNGDAFLGFFYIHDHEDDARELVIHLFGWNIWLLRPAD